jgi:hypothetical protein
VLVRSALYVVFSLFSFKDLIVLNVWLSSISLLIELAAFLWLRRSAPGMARPWRVPGGEAGAWLAAGCPAVLAVLSMATAGWLNTIVGIAAALTGPVVWAVGRRTARAVTLNR